MVINLYSGYNLAFNAIARFAVTRNLNFVSVRNAGKLDCVKLHTALCYK